jgi:hypothetical protein
VARGFGHRCCGCQFAKTPQIDCHYRQICLFFSVRPGGTHGRQSAEKVASQLRELLEQAYVKPDAATEIALDAY